MHVGADAEDEPMAAMNFVPLIDIALTLVIILMVTTAFIRPPGVSLKLPETSTREGAPETKKDLTIAVGKDGGLFMDGQKADARACQARLNQLAALYRRISRSGGKEAGIEPLLQIIGDLGGKIEADAKFLAQFRKTNAPPIQKLQLLIRMAMGETAPIGPATERARLEAKRVMAQPETIHELSREPRMLHQVQTMMNALDRAA